MCRLYGFRANEPTKVDCSLVFSQNALMQQSRYDESGLGHADGWGIVVYQDERPVLLKKAAAAFNDALFSMTAERTYSTTMIAHVRRATVGENSVENTHPFVSGKWSFAHNGTVAGFDALESWMVAGTDKALLTQRNGQTDSELFFFWLLSRLRSAGIDRAPNPGDDAGEWLGCLAEAVDELARRCDETAPDKLPRLNFVLTEGNVMFACRWNHSLYWKSRRGIYDCEICGIPHIHHEASVDHRAVAIASEPVTHEEWIALPNFSLMYIGSDLRHRIHSARSATSNL